MLSVEKAPWAHPSIQAGAQPPDFAQPPPGVKKNFKLTIWLFLTRHKYKERDEHKDKFTLTQVDLSSVASCLSATTSSDNTVAACTSWHNTWARGLDKNSVFHIVWRSICDTFGIILQYSSFNKVIMLLKTFSHCFFSSSRLYLSAAANSSASRPFDASPKLPVYMYWSSCLESNH